MDTIVIAFGSEFENCDGDVYDAETRKTFQLNEIIVKGR